VMSPRCQRRKGLEGKVEMAMDDNARAWQQMAKLLRPRLPGEWTQGRSGIRTVLVRQPVEWVLTWVGAVRSRRSNNPTIWVAQTPLVSEWRGGLALGHGVTSDRPGPGQIDFTRPDAAEVVERFVLDAGLPRVSWSARDFAAEAEEQYAQPHAERGRPLVCIDAAAWRVILETGSPVEPALEAAAWLEDTAMASDEGAWHRALVDAWNSGGRAAAMTFLTTNRDAAVASLKLR